MGSTERTWTKRVDPDARAILAAVDLVGHDGRVAQGLFIVDTGTPVTILSDELAAWLHLGPEKSVGVSRLWGPTGRDLGYRVIVPGVTMLGRPHQDLELRCHCLSSGEPVDGLLGMDILRRGAYRMDLPWGVVEFKWAS